MKLRNLPLGSKIQTRRGRGTLRYTGGEFCRLSFARQKTLKVNPGMPVRLRSNGVYVIGAEIV
jgi:hypothetical protein